MNQQTPRLAVDERRVANPSRPALLATAGLLGAIAASSCCVLPLAFALTGISGAWIGTLTRLSPYQPIFLVFAGTCIGFGFWRVYRSRAAVCAGPECGTPSSRLLTRTVLWISTIILAIAATPQWWAPLFT